MILTGSILVATFVPSSYHLPEQWKCAVGKTGLPSRRMRFGPLAGLLARGDIRCKGAATHRRQFSARALIPNWRDTYPELG